jgi:hypothetical protein
MEKITKEELETIIHSFQKDKSPGLDGFPIDFYQGCFDFIGEDLLKLVKHSRRTRQMHAPFNATFIALIPKVDNPLGFDQFQPISLCNSVYKIIAKIISLENKGYSK